MSCRRYLYLKQASKQASERVLTRRVRSHPRLARSARVFPLGERGYDRPQVFGQRTGLCERRPTHGLLRFREFRVRRTRRALEIRFARLRDGGQNVKRQVVVSRRRGRRRVCAKAQTLQHPSQAELHGVPRLRELFYFPTPVVRVRLCVLFPLEPEHSEPLELRLAVRVADGLRQTRQSGKVDIFSSLASSLSPRALRHRFELGEYAHGVFTHALYVIERVLFNHSHPVRAAVPSRVPRDHGVVVVRVEVAQHVVRRFRRQRHAERGRSAVQRPQRDVPALVVTRIRSFRIGLVEQHVVHRHRGVRL
jgi:hypothetical protein